MNLMKDITGVKVEGILRQAAYVDDVEHRVYEYEEGGFCLYMLAFLTIFHRIFKIAYN